MTHAGGALIGRFRLILDGVRQRHFHHVAQLSEAGRLSMIYLEIRPLAFAIENTPSIASAMLNWLMLMPGNPISRGSLSPTSFIIVEM
jgi:hypothetical protein